MKTKIVFFLMVGSLLGLAAYLVHVPTPVQADDVPEKYRETVRKGLEYLLKHQANDGHWEGDGGQHPVAMTGLAGLALLMEMDNPRYGGFGGIPEPVPVAKNSANINKAVDWLMNQSQVGRDGLIFSGHHSETARYMQGHGLATLFLAGAWKGERDEIRAKRLTDVLNKAVKYIVKAQSTQGGWYHTSKAEGHDFDAILATVIQIQALQAAENAGIPVPTNVISDAQQYLKASLGKFESGAKAEQNSSRPLETAAALACRLSPFGRGQQDDVSKKWFEYCKAEIPVGRDTKLGRDELTQYYFAQAAYNVGGDTWSTYRTAMFDHLQSRQKNDGGWPAGDGISVGQVYATAVWCTILQLDKRSHPSRSPEPITITTRILESRQELRFATKSTGVPKA